jgi:DNA repair protein RadC
MKEKTTMTQQLTLWEQPAPSQPTKPAKATARRVSKLREAAAWTPALADLPAAEQPVHRLTHLGPGALSTIELLAILLGTSHQLQDANQLLAHYGSLTNLARAASTELQRRPGVGTSTVARIKAAFELGRRLLTDREDDRVQIRTPAYAANLLMPEMGLLEQEHLRVILLDTKNRVLAVPTIYVGSLNTSLIRVGELFREAIRANCAAVLVAHNHPSGDPTPSPEDVAVTRQIVEAGKLIDIDVLDHLIVCAHRWVSLKERGLGF